MVEWSLDAFAACDAVRRVVVAVPPDLVAEVAAGLAPGGPAGAGADVADLTVVAGGVTRAQSVAAALEAVDTELVAIHDAARPLLTPALVTALLEVLEADPDAAGVIAAAPVADTLKRAAPESKLTFASNRTGNVSLTIDETVPRDGLWGAQTPQVFRTAVLRAALAVDAATRDAATDEAMLVEAAGGRVLLHHCREQNLKVTTPVDRRLAELLLRDRS